VVAANDKTAIGLALSGGECHDAPEGRKLVKSLKKPENVIPCLMDKAYESDETRETVKNQGFDPVVPPKSNRKEPWEYDKELYKCRNVVERFFRRIKGFRRICTRYDKLDIIFLAFLYLALLFILIRI
jgi:transposase